MGMVIVVTGSLLVSAALPALKAPQSSCPQQNDPACMSTLEPLHSQGLVEQSSNTHYIP